MKAPLHATFVHFTVAFSIAAFGFDLTCIGLKWGAARDFGFWLLILSAVVTIVTIATGICSRLKIPVEEGAARAALRTHMALGPMVFGALVIGSVWRYSFWTAHTSVNWIYILYCAFMVALVTVQGYFGGELVYRFGMQGSGDYARTPNVRERES